VGVREGSHTVLRRVASATRRCRVISLLDKEDKQVIEVRSVQIIHSTQRVRLIVLGLAAALRRTLNP
jgi:hypothetical protein